MVRLGEVVTEFSCKNRDGECAEVYSVTNSGGFVPSTEYFNKEVFSKNLTTYKIVEPGMFAYNPSRINVGSVNFWSGDRRVIVSPLYVVVKVDDSKTLNRYLNYFLHSESALFQIRHLTEGTVRDTLKFSTFQKLQIPLPPLPTQRRIADELDRLCALKKNAEERLAILGQIAKSQFVEMFGDPVANTHDLPLKKMGDILTGIDSGKSFVCENTPRIGSHPAVLKLSAVSIDGYKPDENKSLPSADMFVEKAEVKPGDLLFTRKNTPELVGTCAYVNSTPPFLMMPDLVFRLNPTEEVSRQYLCALINHSLFRPKIQNLASGSAKSMSNISKERLSRLDVPVPPMALQNEFAAFIEQLDKSGFALRETIATLDQLYRAKLQEYFG